MSFAPPRRSRSSRVPGKGTKCRPVPVARTVLASARQQRAAPLPLPNAIAGPRASGPFPEGPPPNLTPNLAPNLAQNLAQNPAQNPARRAASGQAGPAC